MAGFKKNMALLLAAGMIVSGSPGICAKASDDILTETELTDSSILEDDAVYQEIQASDDVGADTQSDVTEEITDDDITEIAEENTASQEDSQDLIEDPAQTEAAYEYNTEAGEADGEDNTFTTEAEAETEDQDIFYTEGNSGEDPEGLIEIEDDTEVEISEISMDPYTDEIFSTNRAGNADDGRVVSSGRRRTRSLMASGYSGGYGNQLSGDARAVYDAIVSNWVNGKGSDKLTITLSTPLEYAPTLTDEGKWTGAKNDSNYLEQIKTIRQYTQRGFDAAVYDYPELYWLDYLSFGTNSPDLTALEENGGKAYITTVKIVGNVVDGLSTDNISSFYSGISSAVSDISGSITADMTNAQKIKVIHDWVVSKCYYISQTGSHSAYPVFCGDGGVVCEGYAKAFQILCRQFGYQCVLVPGAAGSSSSKEGHLWNYVYLPDVGWQMVDCTWDDSGSDNTLYLLAGSSTQGIYGTVSSERNLYNSFSESEYTQTFTLPTLNTDKYHDWKESGRTVTCKSDGEITYSCLICPETKEEEAAATGHSWGDWTTTKAATCTTDGTKERACSVCGEKETGTIPASGHTEGSSKITTAPTCTEAGAKTYYCSTCGEAVREEAVAATGHSWGDWTTTKAATCTTDGTKERACSACGKKETNAIPAFGHTEGSSKITTASTCTKTGVKTFYCSTCGEAIRKETVAASGHSWGNWTTTKAASCVNDGSEEKTCSVCGEKQTRILPKTGHKEGSSKVTTAATCTKAGVKTTYCAVCGEAIETEAIPITAHKAGTQVITKAASCTEPGIRTTKCTECGKTLSAEAIPATGHSWGDWVTTKSATCASTGTIEKTCSVCGAKQTQTTPKTDSHTAGEAKVTKAATCTENGEMTTYCSICGTALKTEAIPATGHTAGDAVVTIPASCESDGVQTTYCTTCNTVLSTETIPATGHSWSEWTTTVEATALKQGTRTRSCAYCGNTQSQSIARLSAFVKISPDVKALGVKKKVTLKAAMQNGDSVKSWRSSNKKVATVSSKGVVTGKKAGTARITVKTKAGASRTVTIKVSKTVKTSKLSVKASGLKNKKVTVKKGKSLQLTTSLTPFTSTQKIKYASSNKKVATVNSKGKIKAKKKGTATITVKSGSKTIKVKVTVK